MIRKLMLKDGPYMLAWMKDPSITKNFRHDFSCYTEKDVISFIENSFTTTNQHFAFVDKKDTYLGTISLKNISITTKDAEFAIVSRNETIGSGEPLIATNEILEYAYSHLNLERIYLNVLTENARAIRFYEKCGFKLEKEDHEDIFFDGNFHSLKYYSKFKKG